MRSSVSLPWRFARCSSTSGNSSLAHPLVHHLPGSTTERDSTCQCVALHHLLSVHRQHSRLFTGARRGRCLPSWCQRCSGRFPLPCPLLSPQCCPASLFSPPHPGLAQPPCCLPGA